MYIYIYDSEAIESIARSVSVEDFTHAWIWNHYTRAVHVFIFGDVFLLHQVAAGAVCSALNKKRPVMDQETANVLFEEGAILVFLDMPEGSEFGMDFNSWNVGPNFRGMKMIPPGVHFVYYR